MKHSIWRVVDANLNRASEGLRVCEDLIRFLTDQAKTIRTFKTIRHELHQIFAANPPAHVEMLRARAVLRDGGRRGLIRDVPKINAKALLEANFKRAEQGMRVLEECSKLIMPKKTAQFQTLRFALYELEKEAFRKF